jgi:uncharacterized Zn finger protein (UPF0148 family)
MGTENKGPLSLLERMKQKAKDQQSYGGKQQDSSANIKAKDCPNCGAGRAQENGITHCAFCGFEFMSVKLIDGINIKKEDNSANY